jgi:trehalose 6-phosphate synthase/phosphatase
MKDERYSFVLAAGDDKTDEFLFQALPDSAYTIRVGLSPSYARYNVTEFNVLLNLLKEMVP